MNPEDAEKIASVNAAGGSLVALHRLVVEELEPGQQLPSEADLAEQFGVSRLTVREALKVLSGRGLVELHRGKRAVVREPDPTVLSDYLTVALRRDPRGMLELLEIRQALEGLAASSAAKGSSRAGISAIEAAISDMEAALDPDGGSQDAYYESDVAFHEALALASGNRMLAFILEGLAGALHQTFRWSAAGRRARGGSVEATLDAHRSICELVTAGDAAGASKAMRLHLKEAEADLKFALREIP